MEARVGPRGKIISVPTEDETMAKKEKPKSKFSVPTDDLARDIQDGIDLFEQKLKATQEEVEKIEKILEGKRERLRKLVQGE